MFLPEVKQLRAKTNNCIMKKKKYTYPVVETQIVNTAYMICDNPASSKAGSDPSAPYAPKKRDVF